MDLISERRLSSTARVIAAAPLNSKLAAVAIGKHLAEPDVELIDIETLQPIHTLPKHGVVRALAWSPDERILATGGGAHWFGDQGTRTESIVLWDPTTGRELTRFGPLFGVRSLAFSPDGAVLVTSGMNGAPSNRRPSVDVWEVASGRHVVRLQELPWTVLQRNPDFTSVSFASGHEAVAAVGPAVRGWNLETGTVSDWLKLDRWIDSAMGRGDRIFTVGFAVEMWHTIGVRCHRLWGRSNEGVATWSPDGRCIARGTGAQVDNHGPYENTAIEILDSSTGELLDRGEHRATPNAVSFLSDSRGVVAGGEEGELRSWRITA